MRCFLPLFVFALVFPFLLPAQQTTTIPWAVNCGNTSSDKALDVSLGADGNVFVSGYFNDNGIFGPISLLPNAYSKEAFVTCLDPAGNFVWAVSGGGNFDDRGLGLANDPQGNVLVTGTYWSSCNFGPINLNGSADHIFLVKIDPNGNFMWGVTGGSDGDDHGYDIVTDPQGNIYMTGYLSNHYFWGIGTAVFGNLPTFQVYDSIAFVAKLDPAGTWQWVQTFGGTDVERDNDLVIDSLGNVYVAGGFYGTKQFGPNTLTSTNGSRDIFVIKYDAAGNFQWVKTTGDSLDDRANGITIDAQQNLYVTGEFRDHVPFGPDTLNNYGGPNGRDIFVARMTTAGSWVWAKRAGSTSGGDAGRAITCDTKGNVFVTGQCKGTVKFGNDTIFATGTDSVQAFVAAIDTSGDWIWALQAGGPLEDRGYGIAVDTSCAIYFCGYFDQSGQFGSNSLTTYGRKDGFIARIDGGCFVNDPPDTTAVPPPPAECTAIIPNVFTPNADGMNDLLGISDPSCITEMRWEIFNRWGQPVFFSSDPSMTWNGTGKGGEVLSEGVYYYAFEASFANGGQVARKGYVSLYR